MKSSVLKNRIPVAVAANQRYYPGLFLTCASIAMSASRNVELAFVILDSGIADDCFGELRSCVKSLHPHVDIRRIIVNDQIFTGFPRWRGNYTTFLRFLLPKLLKDDEFVIYADADTMWNVDIADLWEMRDEHCAIRGCLDVFAKRLESEWFARHGLAYRDDCYVNAGVMILNLTKIRAEGIIDRAVKFLVDHPDVLYPDQTALNAVLDRNAIGLLPAKWNVFSGCLTQDQSEGSVVVHFANEIPWMSSCLFSAITDSMLLWHRCNAKVRKCSIYKSLRLSFSPISILRRRIQFLIAVWPMTRWLYYFFIRLAPASLNLVPRSLDWCRRLNWPTHLSDREKR